MDVIRLQKRGGFEWNSLLFNAEFFRVTVESESCPLLMSQTESLT